MSGRQVVRGAAVTTAALGMFVGPTIGAILAAVLGYLVAGPIGALVGFLLIGPTLGAIVATSIAAPAIVVSEALASDDAQPVPEHHQSKEIEIARGLIRDRVVRLAEIATTRLESVAEAMGIERLDPFLQVQTFVVALGVLFSNAWRMRQVIVGPEDVAELAGLYADRLIATRAADSRLREMILVHASELHEMLSDVARAEQPQQWSLLQIFPLAQIGGPDKLPKAGKKQFLDELAGLLADAKRAGALLDSDRENAHL